MWILMISNIINSTELAMFVIILTILSVWMCMHTYLRHFVEKQEVVINLC